MQRSEGIIMARRLRWLAIVSVALFGTVAIAQYPAIDMVAGKVVQKYQGSTCEQLWQERAQKNSQPKSEREQQAVQLLRNDPQMRAAFIDKVAAPIANKLFECGMIP
ncbi:hypothetical protein PQQ96_11340 [Paraburkholderia sediminicola]|uniref:hypothetical protein n=1 Tax=Paraburkholderia sediminicola TaxID=458836 RepID=UPI0038B75AAA